jgi:hypothetical protein
MSVTALARKSDPLGGRQSLREQIARAAEAQAEVVAIKEAIERAHGLSMASRRKLEAATRAINDAKREDAEQLANALIHGANTTPVQTINRAREEMAAAGDSLEASRAAVTRLEGDLQDAEAAAMRADKAVSVAVAAVVAPIAEQMREEASAARARYLERMFAIAALVDAGLGGKYLRFEITDAEYRQLSTSVGRTWKTALDALREKADDAPLSDLAGR